MMPERFATWAKNLEPRAIAKILTDPAVTGESQRYKTINGKRVPLEPNFFPSIVSTELFNRVQKARSLPHTGDLANLFAGLAQCECCDQPMKYRTKKVNGKKPEGFLCCGNKTCQAYGVQWPYLDFEKRFYLFAQGIEDRGLIKEQRLDGIGNGFKCAVGFQFRLF
jgi:hypothetical protein